MIIRKQFSAEIAHRLVDSYSLGCQNIHGHSYVFELGLESHDLDSTGMLIDFGKVKDSGFKDIIDSWDHAMIFAEHDPMYTDMKPIMDKYNQDYHVVKYNPSAENMAIDLYGRARNLGLPVAFVRVHETKTGYAEYSGEPVMIQPDSYGEKCNVAD